MPLYPYECVSCGHKDDEFQSIHDDHLDECPKCKASSYERRIAATSGAVARELPREMHSIGLCHHDDILAFKRRNPGVECSEDPNSPLYGVPVAANLAEKRRILETEGWEERN